MANRAVSLPYTSSPIGHHSVKLNFDLPDEPPRTEYISPTTTTTKDRSRSELLSGLPDVHVKSHHQHRFIVRNSANNKKTTSKSKTESLIDIEEPTSASDLLEVPFEDVVSRTIHGDFSHCKNDEYLLKPGECLMDQRIDCADDCVNGNLSPEEFGILTAENEGTSTSNCRPPIVSRQISDALIIPDSFERGEDVSVSPSETVMV